MKGTWLVQTEKIQLEPTEPLLQPQKCQFGLAKPIELSLPSRHALHQDAVAEQVVLGQRTLIGLNNEVLLAAEQYRLLCTRIIEVARVSRSKVFLITSAIAEEGKTLTCMNIAYGLSKAIGKKILLVELDLRRPTMHRLLGIRFQSAEISFLESDESWHASLLKLQPNLDVLLAMYPSMRPDELIQDDRVQNFFAEARDEYDFIICDSAPLLVAADTHALLPLIDQALMVVRADHTPINCARDALAILGTKALGCVLNDLKKLKYEEHYNRYYIGGSRDD